MTNEEREYMAAVAQLGCVACRINGQPGTPAEVHHRRSGTGAGRRASHFETIPLCPGHHRFYSDAIHVNARLFVERYGSEASLVKRTRDEVYRYRQMFVSCIENS